MNQALKSDALSRIMQFLYIVFFTCLAFAFNYFSTVSIGLILVAGLVKNHIEGKPLFQPGIKNLFLISCTLFYVLQIFSLLYTENKDETFVHLRIKCALVFVPLALCTPDYLNDRTRKKLLHLFSFILFIASFYCLLINSWKYLEEHDTSVFFYHALVSPINQHAVYFSIYVFIVLLYLVESGGNKRYVFNRWIHFFLILYFSAFIFHLSSKLVISFYLLYIFYYAAKLLIEKKKKWLAVAMILAAMIAGSLLLITNNPISKRFKEILHTDMDLVKKEKFDPGIYFNDVQFRIVEWRLVKEILNENKSWWTGVSPGDAQNSLNKKYMEKNMYVGEPTRGDKGYLDYNTHDQPLESLLQTGIPGFLVFLLILFSLIRIAWKKRSRILNFTVLLLIAFAFIESVFETQYAILLFTFFPLFLGIDEKSG